MFDQLDPALIVDAFVAHYGALTWPFVLDLVTDFGVLTVIALGLYVLMTAGQVSLGHAGLVGISAYAAAVMAVKFQLPFWLSLPLSGGVGLLAGLGYFWLIGLRLSGFYLAIGSFAVGEMLVTIWLNVDYVGGAVGFVGIPLRTQGWLLVLIVPVIVGALWRLDHSRFGIAFRAIRDNQTVAAAMGVDVNATKMLAWMVAGFITGLGGCLHAHRATVLSPTEFGIYFSLTILLAPLLGGLRSVWGTVLGAAIVSFVPWLTTLNDPRNRLMLYGAAIVALMLLRPQGLLSPRAARRRRAGNHQRRIA